MIFKLPDGSEVGAHKLVLGLGSPFFEAQFFGLLASEKLQMIVHKNIDSSAFRFLKSGFFTIYVQYSVHIGGKQGYICTVYR